MVGIGRRLEISFFERFTVPNAIAFVDSHMIHVDRNPDITGGVCDMVVYILIDNKIVGLYIAIAQEIDTRLLDRSELKLRILIFKVVTP